eukprot:TRINITY_DN30367_c0_g1_i1.p1 TRINITY_DN30367_c0_g1~~TRINITY_DN30367_c0_g1_i1.p1  ORF type:complete len:133 (+),score=6.31 TRINITY_DN30367_c0_g1_i1:76-474(+)
MYIDVSGAVAVTQNYCFQGVTVDRDVVPSTGFQCQNGSSLEITTAFSATSSGIVVVQETHCISQVQEEDGSRQVGTMGNIGAAYSAKAILGSSPITIIQPLSNFNYQYQWTCLLYTSPSPRDRTRSRMPSSA